jgi:FRG domain
MLQFKTVTSVSEAIDAFRQWQNFEDPIGGHLRYWFRGQAKSEWPLIPKLFRIFEKSDEDATLDGERHLVRDFRLTSYPLRSGHETPEDLYFLEQHYGMPTRLLDWTANPLVALFFACEGKNPSDRDSDGGVFMLDADTLTGLWPEPNGEVFGIATDSSPEFQAWIRYIFGEAVKNEALIQKPFPILPPHFDRRIALQQGAFSFHPTRRPLDSNSVSRFTVPAEAKEEIRLQLRALNIHRFGIFGDLPSLSEHLQDIHGFRTGFGWH